MIKVNYNEAKKITERLGLCFDGANDGRTFYAYDEDDDEIYEFDTLAERDNFVAKERS